MLPELNIACYAGSKTRPDPRSEFHTGDGSRSGLDCADAYLPRGLIRDRLVFGRRRVLARPRKPASRPGPTGEESRRRGGEVGESYGNQKISGAESRRRARGGGWDRT